ncbi:hypothetical protein A8B82_00415 [Sulfitobacter sp. EhC04]|uniref:DUF2125 domain-containing protein n=1 Tax=Sulfitobacter sp. EhC04 TaxID=1849168 RepID=UPI0007F3C5FB|nr:DUF2125 domain-containing protein [Sulfitobacter sp. EhC04]OAN80548.1 hypothetical protein A8B82_00415 [Sulfitobacter sp. EhC04]
MRRLVILLISVALLWSAWWAGASYALRQGAVAWLQDRRAAGWQAEAKVTQSGFPLRLRSVAQGVALSDPVSGNAVSADRITLSAPTYWPGFVTLDLPQTPIIITLSGQPFRLRAQDSDARLRLRPGTALQLENAALHSGPWLLSSAQGAWLSADSLALTAQQETSAETVYAFDLGAAALTPGDALRGLLNLSSDWPAAFDSFALHGTIRFDRPLDREALTGLPAQPRAVELDRLDLRWGALALSGEGSVTIDAAGVPTGNVTLRLARWQEMIDLAERSGLLHPDRRDQVQLVMGGLANIGGKDGDLEITLAFADGQMALGPIQLGPAPRILRQGQRQ